MLNEWGDAVFYTNVDEWGNRKIPYVDEWGNFTFFYGIIKMVLSIHERTMHLTIKKIKMRLRVS